MMMVPLRVRRVESSASSRRLGRWPRAGVVAALAVALLGMLGSDAAAGTVISGQSSGFAISANLTLTVLGSPITASVSQQALSSGAAPAPYNNSASVANLSVTAGTLLGGGNLLTLGTGLLTSDSSSTVNGGPGPKSAEGTSTVHALGLNVVSTGLGSLLSISADVLTTDSKVTGNYGALTAAGTMSVTNLQISVLGTSIFSLSGIVSPNTGVSLSALGAGASLVLNEQTTTGDGISARGLTTNAVDLTFTNVGVTGLGTLNGQIIISHSGALLQASPAPEPSSWVLMGLAGCGLLVRGLRPRRAS